MNIDPTPEEAEAVYRLIRERHADRYTHVADAIGHGDAQRILRRLVLDGKIEWASNGWLSCTELAEVIPIRRPLTEKYGPLSTDPYPEVHGQWGREHHGRGPVPGTETRHRPPGPTPAEQPPDPSPRSAPEPPRQPPIAGKMLRDAIDDVEVNITDEEPI